MLPNVFKNRMKEILKDDFDCFINSYDKPSYKSLRLNPIKNNTVDLISEWNLTPLPWGDTGYYYDNQLTPGKHPYHEAGVYYIQEASAMLPAVLLDVKPGDKVLDLCAAPGGKSTQIASSMNGKGLLIANEIIPSRAKILSENIERMGIRNAIVTNEDSYSLAKKFPEYFDKIMVDAPCSGEGMFRKNPEACNEWSPENVEMCAERQLEILDNAAYMLAPGGRIVYSTCTFAPQENEGSIYAFLKNHPEFSVAAPNIFVDGFDTGHPEWINNLSPDCKNDYQNSIDENASDNNVGTCNSKDTTIDQLKNCIRLFPHKVKGEGHFACILEKKNDGITERNIKTERGMDSRKLSDYFSFEKEYLNIHFDGPFIMFGNQLYLLPKDTPMLKGIKVLRAGLHLGTFMKKRFEPSHALALALSANEVKNVTDVDVNTARQYISGQTFSSDSTKGWNLITVDGYSLGWGKCSGGVMKNHYPKGLRKI